MYTQCPSCQTIFEVSAEHLKAANGDVRCGQCLNVFNALNHLSEDIPESKDEFLSEDAFQESGQVSVFGNQVEQSTSDEADHSGSETPIPNSEFLETDENDPELEDFFSDVIDDSAEYSQIDYETRLKKQKPLSPDGGFFYGGANESIIEKILTEQEPEERELEEYTLPLEPTPETPGAAEINAGDESEKEQSPTDIPLQLLEDLQEGKLAEEKAASNRFWLTGSIVLMMLFVTQAIYFSRHDLARNPTYRPYLTRACEMIGCTINVKYDIRLIEIIGRDVRSHPSADNALIAGTTLINNASYPQPYPLLTLTFSDITGTKLAERQFTPREYLKSGTDILAGMTPDLPVQVELELVDPGKDAVNFEFHAESDPRTTTLSRG